MRRWNIKVKQARLDLEAGIARIVSMCAQYQTVSIKVLTFGNGFYLSRYEMAAES